MIRKLNHKGGIMKNLILGILSLSIIFAATTALAVDDAMVQAIEETAASANSNWSLTVEK